MRTISFFKLAILGLNAIPIGILLWIMFQLVGIPFGCNTTGSWRWLYFFMAVGPVVFWIVIPVIQHVMNKRSGVKNDSL